MRLGKYVLRYLIGRGGMAEVWAADELGPDGYQNPVAIKLALDALLADADALTLFLQEAKTATALRHGNLVATFSFDRAAADSDPALRGRYYIVMERIEGADLSRMSAALGANEHSCPQKIATFILGEVLKGLAYVHTRKDTNSLDMHLVHRDISPQNILVTYSGEVKISDFGIAKSMRSKHTGSIRGKFGYFAPEILQGEPPSPASDQFAVGVVLWELLAGRALFDSADESQVLQAVLKCEIPPLGREIEPALDAVMRRMLEWDPRRRFPSAEVALEAVFALPGYRPSGAALGKLLAALLPDREKRWTPAVAPRELIEQLSGPGVRTQDYPEPMEPSLGVAIDLATNEAVPLAASFAGQAAFGALTDEAWAAWWRDRGVNRDAEVYGGPAQPETVLVKKDRR
jgi:serine/threonine protein kinase